MRKMITKTMAASVLLAMTMFTTAQAAVSNKFQRALIIVAELDANGPQAIRPMYTALEEITTAIPHVLWDAYSKIEVLRNSRATVANVRARMLELAANPNIKAIDMVFAVHGADERVAMFDRTVTMAAFRDAVLAASDSRTRDLITVMKRKLRFAYNLSCFGESHRGEFRSMGFDIVVGAKAVNVNGEVEYPSVMGLWALGHSVNTAFAPTNNPAALLVSDGPIRTLGNIQGNFLRLANSEKLFNGNKNITITTDPQ